MGSENTQCVAHHLHDFRACLFVLEMRSERRGNEMYYCRDMLAYLFSRCFDAFFHGVDVFVKIRIVHGSLDELVGQGRSFEISRMLLEVLLLLGQFTR